MNKSWNSVPALGKFLDPYHGCWQNAAVETEKKMTYTFAALNEPVEVRFDERLVPHIFAKHNEDAIFIQGYLHAKFRLWQMDMTTRLAGGRLSEVAGEKTLKLDREMRRKGMVFGAENSVKTMEADNETKTIIAAYRNGVNCYIHSLKDKDLPLEYKLMSFEPEEWTNLKTALMIKFMADKLSGRTQDFELTLAKKIFSDDFNLLYPERLEEEYPVVNTNSKKQKNKIQNPKNKSQIPKPKIQNRSRAESKSELQSDREHRTSGIGSNSWALSGSKTKSGKPILCNDPHLPLNLPAIWYENQIVTRTMNVYGVSLPGAPHIVVGFNDSIAWGFTNGYRDVKDFYTIQFKDDMKNEYLLDGKYIPSEIKIETIKIKGKADFKDTVAYTKMGIVMYDRSFPKQGFDDQNFAVNWMAHQGSNELKALVSLNKASNYTDYVHAIQDFHCPHQNIVFASANGDIAMWSQGLFVNKKEGQGRFVEDGTSIQNVWGEKINSMENPHEYNPERGFVMSANQINTGKNYPYYYNGIFTEERAKLLTHLLSEEKKFSVQDMMMMQNNTYWQDASEILPILLNTVDLYKLNIQQTRLLDELRKWDFYTPPESKASIMYDLWFTQLEENIYNDEFGNLAALLEYPKVRVTLQLLNKNIPYAIFDDINTPQKEGKADMILRSFSEMCDQYEKLNDKTWYQYKQTTAEHLAKLPAFSVRDIKIGGGHGIINAASHKDGPSWRMIVHFTNPIEAYGIYPGGESGNVASPYYINMIDDWAEGKYYRLYFAHSPNDIP